MIMVLSPKISVSSLARYSLDTKLSPLLYEKHFLTHQTIFHDLPRLSLLADDEWMTVESLVGVADEEHLPIHTSLPLHNPDSALAISVPAPWVVKAAGGLESCV